MGGRGRRAGEKLSQSKDLNWPTKKRDFKRLSVFQISAFKLGVSGWFKWPASDTSDQLLTKLILESRFKQNLEAVQYLGMIKNKEFCLEIAEGQGNRNTVRKVKSINDLKGCPVEVLGWRA